MTVTEIRSGCASSGTGRFDEAFAVGVDTGGGVYVAGTTDGALPGQQSAGFADAFLRRYDLAGNEIWTRQFGTNDDDSSLALTVDSLGNVYIAGEAGGALPGQTGMGGIDVWLRKYDSRGEELWTRQFGTSGSDSGLGLGLDAIGGVYLVGSTSGELISQSYAGDTDAFLRKYNGDGDHLRTVQFGTESLEEGSDVVVDVAGNVYVTGFVGGAFSGQNFLGGRNDAYVVKFDASLTQVWTRQFGTPDRDLATAVAVGLRGSLYVVGGTEGALAGQASSGKADAFLMKLVGP